MSKLIIEDPFQGMLGIVSRILSGLSDALEVGAFLGLQLFCNSIETDFNLQRSDSDANANDFCP